MIYFIDYLFEIFETKGILLMDYRVNTENK